MGLTMDRERKKRRFNLNLIENTDNNNDTDTDDVKMDKFFAIIRNAKDIRDQLLGIEPPRMTERRVVEAISTAATAIQKADQLKSAVLMPSFQPQDFEEGVIKAAAAAAEDCSNKLDAIHNIDNSDNDNDNNVDVDVDVNGGNGFLLDLNLSL